MNPFTRFLLRLRSRQPEADGRETGLRAFVEHWDALEALVIRVFKANAADEADVAEHAQVRTWLSEHYAAWQAALAVYWPGKRAGGEPIESDPFAWLLAVERAEGFVMNWRAMQVLPAAREALNELVMGEMKE